MTAIQIVQILEPFADDDGETFVQVPIDGRPEPEQIPIESPTGFMIVRSVLAEHKERGLPTDHEVRSLVEIAKGLAYRGPRKTSSVSLKHLLAQSPLAKAVVAIAKDGGTRAVLPRLLAKINAIALRDEIDTRGKPLPKNEDALGCQLAANQKLLAAAGVPIQRNENDRPRTWTIPPLTSSDGHAAKVSVPTGGQSTASDNSDTSAAAHESPAGRPDLDAANELNALIQEVVDERA